MTRFKLPRAKQTPVLDITKMSLSQDRALTKIINYFMQTVVLTVIFIIILVRYDVS